MNEWSDVASCTSLGGEMRRVPARELRRPVLGAAEAANIPFVCH